MVGPAIILVPVAVYVGKKLFDWLFAVVCPQCKKESIKTQTNIYYCKNCNITFNKINLDYV